MHFAWESLLARLFFPHLKALSMLPGNLSFLWFGLVWNVRTWHIFKENRGSLFYLTTQEFTSVQNWSTAFLNRPTALLFNSIVLHVQKRWHSFYAISQSYRLWGVECMFPLSFVLSDFAEIIEYLAQHAQYDMIMHWLTRELCRMNCSHSTRHINTYNEHSSRPSFSRTL